ncbi:peptide deformylase [Psychromicrobium xiongbiense]|uniref:peptide deformylase n=1 Tax=Psychromicrobium xiongbiense TaxID=3051184 RepID=UPI00255296FF|nr:peptide deformylase [Psychromicrobium sp. YIM S02556]
MAILHIRLIGDPVLRTPAAPVTDFGPELEKLVADMTETMNDVAGVGLAAPQIGVSLQVFTYAIGDAQGHVINPTIINSAELQGSGAEGCLSVPGLGFPAPRFEHSVVRGFDLHGEPVTVEGTGYLARCLQHETDHLNGTLFIDRLEGTDRKNAMRSIRQADYSGITAQTNDLRARTVASSFGGLGGTA